MYRALRRIFGAKMFEVKMEWSKLNSEELNEQGCSPKFAFDTIEKNP